MSREDFLSDGRMVDAVVRNLEIIGEAAQQLPFEFRTRNPGIPWTSWFYGNHGQSARGRLGGSERRCAEERANSWAEAGGRPSIKAPAP